MMTANQLSFSLPLLPRKRNNSYVTPRRYEETKPAILQALTHGRIIDLGNLIHRQSLEKSLKEKRQAITIAKEAVWAEAEIVKQEELEAVIAKVKDEHEKKMKKNIKQHEKDIKAEILRVEGEMNEILVQNVLEEKEAGEKRLVIAVQKTEERCHNELIRAVAKVCLEEKESAEQEAIRVARINQEKFEAAMKKATKSAGEKLQALEIQKEKEKVIAVEEVRVKERRKGTEKVEDIKMKYKQMILVLQGQIFDRETEIKEVERQLDAMKKWKDAIEEELIDTREEYQLFIDRTQPYEPGKAGFVLPPPRTIVPKKIPHET